MRIRHTHHSSLIAAVGVAVLTLAAPAVSASQEPAQDRQKTSNPDEVTVTGCLTARADAKTFVLTPLKKDPLSAEMQTRTTDVAPTYTYQLIGGRDLQPHVGQIVNVTGTLDRDYKKEADVREKQDSPTKTPDQPQATVKTKEQAELEIRRLQVKTVDSTGKSCAPSS